MSQPHTASEDDVTYSEGCRDRIEQRIIRAYVQLVATPDRDGSRTVTLGRMGGVEIRLTEAPLGSSIGLPSFWLEIHSRESGSTLDSLGCSEFDEAEMEAAIDFVCDARERHRLCH